MRSDCRTPMVILICICEWVFNQVWVDWQIRCKLCDILGWEKLEIRKMKMYRYVLDHRNQKKIILVFSCDWYESTKRWDCEIKYVYRDHLRSAENMYAYPTCSTSQHVSSCFRCGTTLHYTLIPLKGYSWSQWLQGVGAYWKVHGKAALLEHAFIITLVAHYIPSIGWFIHPFSLSNVHCLTHHPSL